MLTIYGEGFPIGLTRYNIRVGFKHCQVKEVAIDEVHCKLQNISGDYEWSRLKGTGWEYERYREYSEVDFLNY